MSLVMDANRVVAIVIPLPYSEATHLKMEAWKAVGEEIVAPTLWEYEVTSALRRAVGIGLLDSGQAATALKQILLLNMRSLAPGIELHLQALSWAERLGQPCAYDTQDTQYLALVEEIGSELWTGDL